MKTFLLGVGCQKGGTTWLHDYLASHPAVAMGPLKEYHVLNHVFHADGSVGLAWRKRLACQLYRHMWHADPAKKLRYQLALDPPSYFDYFAGLLKDARQKSVTGDITPSYASMRWESLATVRSEFEARGLAVRVIFILRDPVERVISSVRMKRRDRPPLLRPFHHRSEEAELLATYRSPSCASRTRYDLTMQALESAFDRPEILYLFYERLFTEEWIRALTTFLGIGYQAADFDKAINVSRTAGLVGDPVRNAIYDEYAATYHCVADRFGDQTLRQIWPNYARFGPR